LTADAATSRKSNRSGNTCSEATGARRITRRMSGRTSGSEECLQVFLLLESRFVWSVSHVLAQAIAVVEGDGLWVSAGIGFVNIGLFEAYAFG